jgi:DNA-binding NarL/FixJ family response regulator
MGIMRSRAEEVGGSLVIDTSPTTGTRIIVRLPRKLAEETLTHLRILLADDHPLFIEGVRNMLTLRGAQVVGIAKDGIEAQEMARSLKPDMLLMDINMPRMNGLEATRGIKAENPYLKIIMLTTSMDEENLFAALSAGAAGYLLKGMSADEFMTLLGEVALGEAIFSSDMAAKMLEVFARPELQASPTRPRDQLEVLNERQRDVLSLVAQGLTYKQVGAHLFLTERTVKFHMGEILKRLQLKGRRELMDFARRNQAN